MKFQVSDGEKYQKVMEAEIPVEELDIPIKLACKRLANKVNIPGFRKGKAPRTILENFVGIQAILEEASDELMPKAYTDGLKETGLQPVAQPTAEIVNLAQNEPIKYRFTITVKPEITLGQYKGLEVTRRIINVTDEDVDRDLERQQQRLSKMVEVEAGSKAGKGNVLNIDFTGYVDGEKFKGGEGKGYPLELGSNTFIPGFEDQLIGTEAGEEKDVEVTFPADYHETSLAGKPATFKVKVNDIRMHQIPELNDDFAKEVSETADTMEQLKEEVRKRLEEEQLTVANDNAKTEALRAAVDKAEVDLPPVMVENQISMMMEDMANRMQSQGISLEDFLKYTNNTMEGMREKYRDQATFLVSRDLLLSKVAKEEAIEATQEEIEAEIQSLAQAYWQPVEQIKLILEKGNNMDDLKETIREHKAADLIYENAVITDEHVDREALMKEAEAKAEENNASVEGEATDAE